MDQSIDLANIQKGREKRPVVVKVIRKWIVRMDSGHGEPLYAGLVLADAKGNILYAEIPGPIIPKKEYLLDIGRVYIIKKYNVKYNRTTYKAVDKALMIELTEFTTIEVATNPARTFPEYVYNLTPFSEIKPVDGVPFKYTDVLGYITKYTELETFVPKNKEKVTILRKVYIKDLSDKVFRVTLWGEHAADFNVKNIYDEKTGNIIVWLLLGVIPRRYFNDYDKTYLSGSAACCYHFNPHIPEATPFYTRFKDIPVYIEQPAAAEEAAPIVVTEKPLKPMTIAELNAIEDPFDFEEGAYKTAVTVTSIPDHVKWWYIACKRHKNKSLLQSDHTYKCSVCGGSEIAPRYLLSFMGRDETAEALFFAYDSEAAIIIGRECESIMNPLRQPSGLPPQLTNIINKRYVFTMGLSDGEERKYVVKAVLERPSRHNPPRNISTPSQQPEAGPSRLLELASPSSSTPIIQSPMPERQIVKIQSTAYETPAPGIDDDENSPTNKQARSSTPPAAKRKLFDTSTIADEIHGTSEQLTGNEVAEEDADMLPENSPPPKGKRTKSSAEKNVGKHPSRK